MNKAPQYPWQSEKSTMTPVESEDDLQNSELESTDESNRLPRDEDPKKKLSKPHQLLLDIAKSTSPHLSSPSPQVRRLLLGLIEDIVPLLCQDENTFLPLVNAVWPSIVARLINLSEDPQNAEASYNICAAAETMAVLCKSAGNFMSTRIDEIFPKVCKLLTEGHVWQAESI